ncbi:MAG: PrsW family glutamic-type intramembrane protease [Erythrobacter sp.]
MEPIVVLNAALALAPVLLLLGAFLWLDVLHLLSARMVATLLAMGGLAAVAAYPLSGGALDALPLGFSGYSRFVAPWIEEALKGVLIIGLFLGNRIGYKIDAALCGLAIGAGFAIVENVIYLVQHPAISPGIWLVRGVGTAVMHSGAAAIMAAVSHQFNERSLLAHAGEWKFHPTSFVPGYLLASALHLAFNQFPEKPLVPMVGTMLIVPLVVIVVFRFGAREASHFLDVERAEHAADQPALEAGEWPDSESGRQLSAFVSQNGDRPELRSMVIEYWRLLGELVLSAEDRMVERANGVRHDPQAELDRERFEQLARTERQFDPPTLRMVKRLLPFSRNDLWDIAELREQLDRK